MLTSEKSFELNLARMSPDRRELLDRFTDEPTQETVRTLSRFLKALCETVAGRRRTELRGLGVFEWKPVRGKLPTGRKYRSWRLVFTINQGVRRKGVKFK